MTLKQKLTEFVRGSFSEWEIVTLANFLWMMMRLRKSPFLVGYDGDVFFCNLTMIHTTSDKIDDAKYHWERSVNLLLESVQKKMRSWGIDYYPLVQWTAASFSATILSSNKPHLRYKDLHSKAVMTLVNVFLSEAKLANKRWNERRKYLIDTGQLVEKPITVEK